MQRLFRSFALLAVLSLLSFGWVQAQNELKAGEFKPLLKLDDKGKLTEIPMSFVDWNGGKAEVKAWEANYGSTQTKEDDLNLFFQTNDPENNNLMRFYRFSSKGKLSTSVLAIKPELLFRQTTNSRVNDRLESLLFKDGYKKMDSSNDETAVYDNGFYKISFIIPSGEGKAALMMIFPSTTPTVIQFVKDAMDFPFLKNDFLEKWTLDEIKGYEETLGLRSYEGKDAKGLYVFKVIASKATQTNFLTVKYEIEGDSKDLGVTAISSSLNNIDMLDNAEVKAYFEANGFKYDNRGDYSGYRYMKFKNDEKKFYCLVLEGAKGSSLIFSFSYYGSGENPDTPEPGDKRRPFYLPVDGAFEMPLTPDSPIFEAEKARGFTAEYKEGGADEYGIEFTNQITAFPPFDADYSKDKIGVGSVVYTRLKSDAEDKITNVQLIMNSPGFKAKSHVKTEPEFEEMLIKRGYIFKGLLQGKDELVEVSMYQYYNPTNHQLLQSGLMKVFGQESAMHTVAKVDKFTFAPNFLPGVTFVGNKFGQVSASAGDATLKNRTEVKMNTSVTFTAVPNEGCAVSKWTVNGVDQDGKAETLKLTIAEPTVVEVVFYNTSAVDKVADSTLKAYMISDQTLKIQGLPSDETVWIYDLSGRMVQKGQTNFGQIDLPYLSQGVYVVTTSHGNTKFVR